MGCQIADQINGLDVIGRGQSHQIFMIREGSIRSMRFEWCDWIEVKGCDQIEGNGFYNEKNLKLYEIKSKGQ